MTDDHDERSGSIGDQQQESDAPTPDQCARLRKEVMSELAYTQTVTAAPRSLLELDNQFMSSFHTSMHELVVNRLFSSFDHLQLTADSLEKSEHGLIFSQYSLIRAALAGAATASWLTSGNTTERRKRALKLAYYDLEQERTFANLIAMKPVRTDAKNAGAVKNAGEVIASAPRRLEAIYNEYCKLHISQGKTKIPDRNGFGFEETAAVEEASRMMKRTKRIKNEKEILLQYRLMSGFVHNCLWATRTGTRRTRIESDEFGPMIQITGNPGNIYKGARTAFVVALLAKARLVELAKKP